MIINRSFKKITWKPINIDKRQSLLISQRHGLNDLLSKGVITDSGGVSEETTVMNIPCMTIRDSTERPETIEMGTNVLLGTSPKAIKPAMEKLFSNKWKNAKIPPLWDGKSSERIVKELIKFE